MHVEDQEAFTTWLFKELRPICDAEPAVLAKYVLSLIRKPDKTPEELRKFCEEQLDVFLQTNTKRFAERMFAALKDNSYMENRPSSSKPPAEKVEKKAEEPKKTVAAAAAPVVKEKEIKKEVKEENVEEPKATTSRDVKTVPEKSNDDRSSRRLLVVRKDEQPTKKEEPKLPRKRISPPAVDAKKDAANRDRDLARRRSRTPPRSRRERGERGRRSPEHSRRHARKGSRSRSPRTPEKRERKEQGEERRKKRCRDYDEIGYCTRGDLCHFDHGADPVLVDRTVVDKMGPMAKGIAPNMSIPPPGYNPVNPPPPGVEGIFGGPPPTAPVVEGYNPEAPALTSANFSIPPPPLPLHMTSAPWRPTPYSVAPVSMGISVYEPSAGVPIDPSSAAPPPVMRGGGPYRGRGRGAAAIGGGPRFNPTPRNGDGKTLLVRKIPVEQNTITKLNEHFGQFGNIVNIQVRYNDDPEDALVTFTCRMEATKAIKSPEPVLNNRFIKVVWYNPDHDKNAEANGARTLSSGVSVNKPQPAVATPAEYTPKPKVANFHEVKLFTNNYTNAREILRKKKELQIKAKTLLETQKKQAVLLDTLLKQQKKILTKIRETDLDAESKKRLHALAKETSGQITNAKEMTESVRKQLEETNISLKELQEQINVSRKEEQAATNGGEAVALGKRKADIAIKTEDGAAPAKKRIGSSLMISGFTLEDEESVTAALEMTGELVDVEIQPGNGAEISAIYTFKEATSAEKVMEDGLKVNEKQLAVSWVEDKEQENNFQSTDA